MAYNVFEEATLLAQQPAESDSSQWEAPKRFLYQLKLPGVWAHICLVACALTNHPVLKIRLLIECVNGLRREPGRWDSSLASGLLQEVKRRIDSLTNVEKDVRMRLTELWCYHSGWVLHPAGQFEQAASSHRIGALVAADRGDARAQALAEYNAHYENLHFGITLNDITLEKRFVAYLQAAEDALKILAGNGDEDVRWRANILCHVAFFEWVVRGNIDVAQAREAIQALDEKTKPAFGEAGMVLAALQVFNTNPDLAADIACGASSPSQIDWWSYGAYVRALALEKSGVTAKARSMLIDLKKLPDRVNGGHLVAALIENRHKL